MYRLGRFSRNVTARCRIRSVTFLDRQGTYIPFHRHDSGTANYTRTRLLSCHSIHRTYPSARLSDACLTSVSLCLSMFGLRRVRPRGCAVRRVSAKPVHLLPVLTPRIAEYSEPAPPANVNAALELESPPTHLRCDDL